MRNPEHTLILDRGRMSPRSWIAVAVLFPAVIACGRAGPEAAGAAPVDTVHAMEVEFLRFTADLPAAPAELAGGAASLDELARRFVGAVSARDTAALRSLHLDRAEFAHLYYRSAPVSRPPYELPPGLLWFQIDGISARGITRLLHELGGDPLLYRGVACPGAPERQEQNLVHAGCRVEYETPDGSRRTEKLFGNVLERGGRFKFVSYANDYD
jgi:predicted small lipoprotein YifL